MSGGSAGMALPTLPRWSPVNVHSMWMLQGHQKDLYFAVNVLVVACLLLWYDSWIPALTSTWSSQVSMFLSSSLSPLSLCNSSLHLSSVRSLLLIHVDFCHACLTSRALEWHFLVFWGGCPWKPMVCPESFALYCSSKLGRSFWGMWSGCG